MWGGVFLPHLGVPVGTDMYWLGCVPELYTVPEVLVRAAVAFSAARYLRVCLSSTAVATTGLEISGIVFVVAGRVYVGKVFATTMFRICLVQ